MVTEEDVVAKISAEISIAEKDPNKGGEEAVRQAVEAVRENFKITCNYAYCGGFDSTGYDIDCYAIAFITDDGTLGIYYYQYETY